MIRPATADHWYMDSMRSPLAFNTLTEAAGWYASWLQTALPLWAEEGVDPIQGAFREALDQDGRAHPAPRRSRTQARQIWVFATAYSQGLASDGLKVASRGFDFYLAHYQRPDGLFARLADEAGAVLDDTPAVYEQSFSLLAMASLLVADPSRPGLAEEGRRLRSALGAMAHPAGGFREFGEHPFQANAHMHLLEASLAWEEAGETDWKAFSDEIAELALTRFIDSKRGFVREFFDADWRSLNGEHGLMEPGHQFEWAWLLDRWGQARGRSDARAAARRLFDSGRLGVDRAREVAVNALWENLTVRDPTARLWPQTEYLKVALRFGAEADALLAARGLARYLDTPAPGVWRDRMLADGGFLAGPAPATSFYHVLGAVGPLLEHTGRLAALEAPGASA